VNFFFPFFFPPLSISIAILTVQTRELEDFDEVRKYENTTWAHGDFGQEKALRSLPPLDTGGDEVRR
jgi:hypothetical protein